ncbi:class I adenylate-forming enzyme family protein [Dietzia maris]|uniref:class I adenylate-forming enzyme family protein n=1 Tax=Dietzia maris TaxID=37915 RepID=UPI0037C6825D
MADTVAGLLRQHATDPEKIFAVLSDGTTITYTQQSDRSLAAAAGLHARHVMAGDRVLVRLANGREFFDIWFATALVGAVMVPVNPDSTDEELAHLRRDCDPAAEIAEPAEVDTLRQQGARCSFKPDHSAQDPDRLAAILYTSGTTSLPKGVMITERNYLTVGAAVADHLAMTADDRWLICLPLFHANAQFYCAMSALTQGASIAVTPRFSASRWGQQVQATGATLGSLFAAPVRMILANPATHDQTAPNLRCVMFAQNLSEREVTEFETRFDTTLLQIYGMTETVLPPTMNPLQGGRHHSIGRALPGVRIDLLDESGQISTDDTGEMRISGTPGHTLAAGYWRNPAATAEAFSANGLRTGDVAHRDPDGFYYFVDRTKDMIKRGGENVAASEIEAVALHHPAVSQCAAVAIPDSMLDEAIALVVVPEPGTNPAASELLDWCQERLSRFKVPSVVTFVDALPRTSVGKVRKSELKTLFTTGEPTPRT